MDLHRKAKKDIELRRRLAKEVFEAMDMDADGVLSKAEVMALQKGSEPSKDAGSTTNLLAPRRGRELVGVLTSFFEVLDASEAAGGGSPDGQVSMDEWVAGLTKAFAAKDDHVYVSVIEGMLDSLGKSKGREKRKAKSKGKKR